MITFLLGIFCGVCYTLNLEELFDGKWGKWLLSPITLPWRIIYFFTHPPIA